LNDYLKNVNSYSTFVDESYVEPKSVSITFPEKKRNLIYIFIESMEVTFTTPDHGGEFEMNLIPELETLASEGEDFSGDDEKLNGALATEMTTWTIAGMFAQTTGMPLKSDLEPNDTKQLKESFYSNITSLGDVLEKEGYKQYLLLGSDARFGGRKTYFSKHGNYNIHDYLYAVDNNYIPSNYYKWWGYEDEKLFDFAKKELTEISKTGEPFNYTLLTADTHPEDGYVCEKCSNEYDVQYANVIACSSKQVYDFVRWIQQQPFYENTTIVLCGDHPTMEADFCKGKKNRIHRKTYTCILNSAAKPVKDTKREYTTLDLFPTTLAAMGAEIEGEKLALGTNLYSDKETLVEANNLDEINKALLSRSKLCEQLFYSEEEMNLDNPLRERTTEDLLIPESAEE
ncbi:MAG: LTA synthase family protein, partial [Eubacterium sp.]|nr:LTA synthase family protein [Eubacterium sp.]